MIVESKEVASGAITVTAHTNGMVSVSMDGRERIYMFTRFNLKSTDARELGNALINAAKALDVRGVTA